MTAALSFGLSQTPPARVLEWATYDWRMRSQAQGPQSDQIRLVAIDDPALKVVGRWPWPREHHAGFIKHLMDAGPAVSPATFAYDMLFTESDQSDPASDLALADAAQRHGGVLFGYYLTGDASSHEEVPPSVVPLTHVSGPISQLPAWPSAVWPLPPLVESGLCGYLNAEADPDGVVRRIPLVARLGDRVYPSMSLLIAARALQVPSDRIHVRVGQCVELHQDGGQVTRIPIDRSGKYAVCYVGGVDQFTGHSIIGLIYALMNPQEKVVDLSQYAGRVALIGMTATGSSDIGAISLARQAPLFLVHANAADNILSGRFLKFLPKPLAAVLGLVVVLACIGINLRASPVAGALINGSILLVYAALSGYAMAAHQWVVPLVPILMVVVSLYVVQTGIRFFESEGQRRWIQGAFSRYLSANVMEAILKDPSWLQLHGQRRELSSLFCDLRNFTAFCEHRPPEEVVTVLNEYLAAMTECVMRHDGTLDKYVGDAVVAFFGAPSPELQTDHAWRAVQTALDMEKAILALQSKWKARGQEPLDIGVGINTGPMLVGNIGSEKRMDYTVIGDEVNLTARVEALTRQYPCRILITEATRRHVDGRVIVERMGEVTVKGRTQPVEIYALKGLKT